jgi:transcriptional regulator
VSKPFLAIVPNDEESSETKEARRASAISELFELARRGEVPRERELYVHEPNLLNERHLQVVMMRACLGMKQKDIAAALGYTDSTVSIVLNHPDAKYVIDRIQGMSGAIVVDISARIDERLKGLRPRAVDSIEDVFDDPGDDSKALMAKIQKARMGFSLLEHTGHGPSRQVDIKHDHAFRLDSNSASLLTRALRESNEIEEADYTIETPGSGVEGSGSPTALPLGTGAPPLGVSQEPSLDPKVN